MSNSSFGVTRPFLYVLAAVVFGSIVGFLREGTPGGALVLGVTIGVGVTIGLVIFEAGNRYGPF